MNSRQEYSSIPFGCLLISDLRIGCNDEKMEQLLIIYNFLWKWKGPLDKALQSFYLLDSIIKKLNNKKYTCVLNEHTLQLFRIQKNTLSFSWYPKPASQLCIHFPLKIIYIPFVMENNLMPFYCNTHKKNISKLRSLAYQPNWTKGMNYTFFPFSFSISYRQH